ncbi:MAG TPA: mechanosensitive ion channel family protein [Burkholderiales bacterium]|jgi:small-conductance mechanosensitive channel|nr:mechanosensitive ion channel family protein [Burkholderiales bacterium]
MVDSTLSAAMHSEVPWLTLLALVVSGLLLRFRPHERPVFLNTLWLFLFGVAGQAAAWGLDLLGVPGASSVVHTVFRIVSAIALIRLLGFALFRLLLPLARREPPRIIEDLSIVVVYVVYAFAQLRGAGVDLSSIVTTSAILTAVVAFAMQDTLGNVIGGLAIHIDNSVQVGDWVRVDGLTGRVRDIGWRSTTLETTSWETVVVPNSTMMKGRVAILGKREGNPLQWRRTLSFMVDPGVPPARVIATVNDEMRDVPIANVARAPAPSTVLHGFEAGNLSYHLRYFLTDLAEEDMTDSMVRVHLFASLQRAGIRIAEEQRTVHSVARDEAHADAVRRREIGRRLEMLRGVDLFSVLSEDEIGEVAERLQYAPFARGDIITKQGNIAHWLYIVAFGEVEVRYEPEAGEPQVLATLRPGQFFGEMALLTGDARSATVISKTDVECYRLDRVSFQGLLLSRPEIAEGMSRVLSSRKPELEKVREAFATQPVAAPVESADLLRKIQRFFGIRR